MTAADKRKIRRWLVSLVDSGLYTGRELADDMGISTSVLSRVKNGVRDISDNWFKRHSKGILSVALATGNNAVRDMVYELEDEQVETTVEEHVRKGNIIMPVSRAQTVLASKTRGRVR